MSLLPESVTPIMPMWFGFDIYIYFLSSLEKFLMTQSDYCGDSCPYLFLPPLICPIVAPYVTLTNMWVRPGNNELVSYESRSISRAEKFISLVHMLPWGVADSLAHARTRVRWRASGTL